MRESNSGVDNYPGYWCNCAERKEGDKSDLPDLIVARFAPAGGVVVGTASHIVLHLDHAPSRPSRLPENFERVLLSSCRAHNRRCVR